MGAKENTANPEHKKCKEQTIIQHPTNAVNRNPQKNGYATGTAINTRNTTVKSINRTINTNRHNPPQKP